MGEEEACHLDSKCRVKLESKNGKKQCRLLSCCVCEKHFHALCVNYQSLPESEFNALKEVFTCTRCYKLVDAISSQIEERISKIFNNHILNGSLKGVSSKIASTQTHTETHDDTKNNTPCNNILPNSNSTNMIIEETNNGVGKNDNVTTNQTIDNLSLDKKKSGDKFEDKIVSINKNEKYENPNMPKIQTDCDTNNETLTDHVNDMHNINTNENFEIKTSSQVDKNIDKNTEKHLYLCGIETVLSINDVKIILEDYNVHLNTIELSNANGSFSKRKYINIHSSSMADIFKFKHSFSNSSLYNTWFLRETPPKQKTYAETLLTSKDITIKYTNLNRDKILLKNQLIKQKPSFESQTITTITVRPPIAKKQRNNFIPIDKTNFRNKISNEYLIRNNTPPLTNNAQTEPIFLSNKSTTKSDGFKKNTQKQNSSQSHFLYKNKLIKFPT